MKKTLARMLALLLALLLLCGCAAPAVPEEAAGPEPQTKPVQTEPIQPAPAQPEPVQTEETPEPDEQPPTLVGGGYLPEVYHPELPFAEMQPSTLTREDAQRLCRACTEAAQSGSQAEFHRAFTAAFEMLYELECASSLYTLRSNADAENEALLKQAADSEALLNEADDLFFSALETISRSEGSRLLKKEAPEWLYSIIIDYNADDSAEWLCLSERETKTEQEYERLSVDDPMNRQAIGNAFLELVQTRKQIAALNGYADFPAYAYEVLYGRTYTPADAEAVWKTAKEDFAPIFWRHIREVQNKLMHAEISADCSEEAVVRALDEGCAVLSPELHEICEYMIRNGLYDLSASEKKLDIGYTVWLSVYDVPFIFSAGENAYPDYQTLFHEFGHFVGAFCHGSDAMFGTCDLDLSELQSQGMEVLFLERYDEIFGQALADALIAEKVLDFVYSILTGAMFDEFQQRVYREPELTTEKINTIYAELRREYGFADEPGCEYRWMDVIHNFEYPLYYISYAVSAFPTLELFLRQRESPADAADAYLRIAAMGDEEYTLEEVIRSSGFVDVLRTHSGYLIADALENCGVFDGF